MFAVRVSRDTSLLEQATEVTVQAMREMDGKASVNIREVHVLDAARELSKAKRAGINLDLVIVAVSQFLTSDVQKMIVNIRGADPLLPIFAITEGMEKKFLEEMGVVVFDKTYLTAFGGNEIKKKIKEKVGYARKQRVNLANESGSGIAKNLGYPSGGGSGPSQGKHKLRF